MRDKFYFSDNRMVGKVEGGAEYLRVVFKEADDPNSPDVVTLNRYCVPGRIDIYDFGYAPSPEQGYGDRVRYFTDTSLPLCKAVQQVKRDLNKAPVVKMLLKACQDNHRYYGKTLLFSLLGEFGETKSSVAIREYYEADNLDLKKLAADFGEKLDKKLGAT